MFVVIGDIEGMRNSTLITIKLQVYLVEIFEPL